MVIIIIVINILVIIAVIISDIIICHDYGIHGTTFTTVIVTFT